MKPLTYALFLIVFSSCHYINPRSPWEELKDNEEEQKIVNSDSTFLEYVNENIITPSDDKKFISDIFRLKSVRLTQCDRDSIHYQDEIDGKKIELKLTLKKFEQEQHMIEFENGGESNVVKAIDGKKPWGTYLIPTSEIDQVTIMVDNHTIDISYEMKDIFNLPLCNLDQKWENFNPNPLLKYDLENEVLYLYIKGGDRSFHFLGKFIFDENKFIKRYMLDYGDLSVTGSFREDFKGF